MIAGTGRRSRHCDQDRGATADQLARRDVRQVLGLVVVAQEPLADVATVRLVDDLLVGVAQGLDARYVDDARDSGRDRGLEDAMRRPDIRFVHLWPLAGRDADAVAARQV